MASVVTFWQHPDEEHKFLSYLAKTDGMLACIDERVPDPAPLTPRPIRQLIEREDPRHILMGVGEFMDMTPIVSFDFNGRTLFSRHYMDGPVICYSRPVWRGPGSLGQSNLVYRSQRGIPDPSDPDGTVWVPQPAEFLAWGRRVLGWMRRHTQPHGYYRVTPRIATEVENGLELVP